MATESQQNCVQKMQDEKCIQLAYVKATASLCHPEGPGQTGRISQKEPHEIQRKMPILHLGGRSPWQQYSMGISGQASALQKSPWGQQARHEWAVCPGSKGGHQHPGLCEQNRVEWRKLWWPSTRYLWDHIQVLHVVLGSPKQEIHQQTQKSSVRCHQDGQGWSVCTVSRGWGSWARSACRRNGLGGDQIAAFQYLWGGYQEDNSSSSQCGMEGGWEAAGKIQTRGFKFIES